MPTQVQSTSKKKLSLHYKIFINKSTGSTRTKSKNTHDTKRVESAITSLAVEGEEAVGVVPPKAVLPRHWPVGEAAVVGVAEVRIGVAEHRREGVEEGAYRGGSVLPLGWVEEVEVGAVEAEVGPAGHALSASRVHASWPRRPTDSPACRRTRNGEED